MLSSHHKFSSFGKTSLCYCRLLVAHQFVGQPWGDVWNKLSLSWAVTFTKRSFKKRPKTSLFSVHFSSIDYFLFFKTYFLLAICFLKYLLFFHVWNHLHLSLHLTQVRLSSCAWRRRRIRYQWSDSSYLSFRPRNGQFNEILLSWFPFFKFDNLYIWNSHW